MALKDNYFKRAYEHSSRSHHVMIDIPMSGKSKHKGRHPNNEIGFKLASRGTTNTILSIVTFALAILFLLAAFNHGGRVGSLSFDFLSRLFGIGYYLLPVIFSLLAISFFRETEERRFATPQIIGSLLLFLSALGLADLIFRNRGGLVGGLISNPLVALFDLYASSILLITLIIVVLCLYS